jgi:hypothetical protein
VCCRVMRTAIAVFVLCLCLGNAGLHMDVLFALEDGACFSLPFCIINALGVILYSR